MAAAAAEGVAEGGGGGGGTTSFRSILDKPLTQLTEEDISQLTREDCRNYLKQKGMRRPSWNKSQAIQQVISLKALLETSDDDNSGAGPLRRILVPNPPPPPPATPSSGAANSAKEPSVEPNASSASVSRDESFSCRRNDSPKAIPPAVVQLDARQEEIAGDDKSSAPSKSMVSARGSVGQMTIFYGGKVNVYDGIPLDKACAIMHLAASPVQLSLDDLPANMAFSSPSPRQIQGDKRDLFPHDCAMSPTTQTEKLIEHPHFCRERGNVSVDPGKAPSCCPKSERRKSAMMLIRMDVEGQASRKLSLQRYLEKKRDRGRFKGKKTFGTSCPSLEMFLNHHNRMHATSGHLTTSSPSQPRANNQEKIANFSVDLNEDTQEF